MSSRIGDGQSRRRLKRRCYELFDDATLHPQGRLLHWGLIGLVIASVAAVVLESVPSIAARYEPLFLSVEAFAVVVFTVEYAARLWCATEHPLYRSMPAWKARLKHATTSGALVDLIAVAPLYLSMLFAAELRILILVRLLRFFKLARYSPGMRSLIEAIVNERNALLACLMLVGGLMLIAASLMHLVEGDVQPDKLGTIPDAMYWAVITLSTVGYGDVSPVTTLGKVIASITALCGLVTLAMPVGIIATSFAHSIQQREFVVTWSMVARVPIFSELAAADIADIMRCLHSRTAEEEEVVLHRGDPAGAMFFIGSGEVEIEKAKPIRLGEGQFFGEAAMVHDTPSTATVRALTRTRLMVLDAADLRALMKRKPAITRALRHAATRLRENKEAKVEG